MSVFKLACDRFKELQVSMDCVLVRAELLKAFGATDDELDDIKSLRHTGGSADKDLDKIHQEFLNANSDVLNGRKTHEEGAAILNKLSEKLEFLIPSVEHRVIELEDKYA